ncbi:MAG TPA: cation transporter [Burkholderiaceae bacterium]|nr:cation transporter [Burkholderiaceae bacterium]
MKFTEPDVSLEDGKDIAVVRAQAASRSTWGSVAVNFLLSSVEVLAGVFSHSQGLSADGIHPLSNLFEGHHSKKGADADHPYWYQRFETAASMLVGVLLLTVGGNPSIFEAARK